MHKCLYTKYLYTKRYNKVYRLKVLSSAFREFSVEKAVLCFMGSLLKSFAAAT